MSAVAPRAPHAARSHVVADALVLTKRNLLRYVRLPQLLVFSTIQPVMFVLLFAFVFGGAISTPAGDYIDFLLPGIFVQTSAFGSTMTGVGLAEDLQQGIIDRFRALPMARSAVLAGRTISDTARNLFVVLLMAAVGYLIGFDIKTGVVRALAALGLLLLFGFAFSWISAAIGLGMRSAEAAQSSGFLWVFPLTFASSAFVPTDTMPGWLQVFAEHTPVTYTVNALRALLLGGPTADAVVGSLLWSLGILAVFVPMAVSRYRRST